MVVFLCFVKYVYVIQLIVYSQMLYICSSFMCKPCNHKILVTCFNPKMRRNKLYAIEYYKNFALSDISCRLVLSFFVDMDYYNIILNPYNTNFQCVRALALPLVAGIRVMVTMQCVIALALPLVAGIRVMVTMQCVRAIALPYEPNHCHYWQVFW